MRHRCGVVVLLMAATLTVSGCESPTAISENCFPGGCGPFGSGLYREANAEIDPTWLPHGMKVGETAYVKVTPLGEDAAEGNRVAWHARDPNFVRWSRPESPCAFDGCALLEAVAPGSAHVSIFVCPPGQDVVVLCPAVTRAAIEVEAKE